MTIFTVAQKTPCVFHLPVQMVTALICLHTIMYAGHACANNNNHDLWLDEFESAPTVHIAHIAQNIRNTSASVTRITREDIQRWELRDWHDVLRLVPGMTVVKKSAPRSSIDYNANGTRMGSGLEILVDGIQQTIPAQSTAFVQLLPPLEMVDTIEVVRGSNAAADGGSISFKGTIHITTRQPEFQDQPHFLAQASTRQDYRTQVYYNNRSNNHHVSLMAQYRQSNGFDKRGTFDHSDPAPVSRAIEDDMDIRQLRLQYSHKPAENTRISSLAEIIDANFTIPGTTLVNDRIPENDPADSSNYAAAVTIEHWLSESQRTQVQLSHQHWRWRQHASICGPAVFLSSEASAFIEAYPEHLVSLVLMDIDSIPSSTELDDLISAYLADSSSVCTRRNQSFDIDRSRLTAQYLKQWRTLHWISGIDLATSSIGGPQFGSDNRYNRSQIFSHLQWDIHRQLTANLGARLERFGDKEGFSGRAGLNIHINRATTLRLVSSYSEKLPDIADLDNNFKQLTLNTDTPVYGNLEHQLHDGSPLPTNESAQTIQSSEIGLFWQFSPRNTLDTRLFYDRMRNISTYDISLIDVPSPENTEKSGAEMHIQGQLGLVQYSLALHYQHSSSDQKTGQYERYGLSLASQLPLTDSTSLISHIYYSQTDLTIREQQRDHIIDIVSLGLKQQFSPQLSMTLTARYDGSNFTNHFYLSETSKANYDKKGSIIYTIKYTF